MTPTQILKQIEQAESVNGHVILQIPLGFRREIAGSGFPRGELLNENPNGMKVYAFKPSRLRVWLARNDLLQECKT